MASGFTYGEDGDWDLSGVKFLGSDVRWFLTLSSKRSVHAKVVKPDAMTFNLVLDACVRLKSSLRGQEIVDLMSQTGVVANAHSPLLLSRSMK